MVIQLQLLKVEELKTKRIFIIFNWFLLDLLLLAVIVSLETFLQIVDYF